MEQITRAVVRGVAGRVGVDLAKRVIQVHAVDAAGQVLTSRALARDKFLAWCAQLPAGCIVAMETSSSSHHWARKLIALSLDARIIAAQLVSPYRRQGASGKNDANDAAAVARLGTRGDQFAFGFANRQTATNCLFPQQFASMLFVWKTSTRIAAGQ